MPFPDPPGIRLLRHALESFEEEQPELIGDEDTEVVIGLPYEVLKMSLIEFDLANEYLLQSMQMANLWQAINEMRSSAIPNFW